MIHLGPRATLKLSVIVVFAGLLGVFAMFGGRDHADASASGPSPSFTGAPGENSCIACHSDFPINSGGGNVTITGIPHDYLPGQQIEVTVKTTHENATYWGFQLTALDQEGRQAGTFTVPSAFPQKTQIVSGLVGGNTRQYVEHTTDGLFTNGVFNSNSWIFTWTAPAQRVGKIGFFAAGNGANGFGDTSGDYIYTGTTASLSGTAISNFNGDSASDLAVFRPSTGIWYHFSISNGANGALAWGQAGDRVAPGDFDGDGATDFALWRPSNSTWYVRLNAGGFVGFVIGLSTDIPVPADYDGDLKTDFAVYRPSNSTFYVYGSTSGWTTTVWGETGDKPVPADYDADGKADIATFRPSDGIWRIQRSTGGSTQTLFGISEDKPVPADYDGDGKTDLAVYRPSTDTWWIARSATGTFTATQWGVPGDTPAPADLDGDGKTDLVVFRASNGTWYSILSSGGFYGAQFGTNGDVAVPTGYVPQ